MNNFWVKILTMFKSIITRVLYTFNIFAVVVYCLLHVMSCTSSARYPLKVRRISDRVIVISCMKVNVTAVRGNRGLVIIDTNRSPAIMKEIWSRIEKEFHSNKVLRVINTHGHWDHTSGNQNFPGSIIVGQENCPEFMRQTRKMVADDQNKEFILTPPARTFRDSATFDAGGIGIRMYYAGNAHTNNDIFVFIPSEKVLLIGDLFGQNSLSFKVNRLNDIPRIIGLLGQFVADSGQIGYVIPGHGDEILTVKDLADTKDALEKEYGELEQKRSAALILSELLKDNEAGAAVIKYEALRKEMDPNYYCREDEFALVGRHLLWKGEMEKAIVAFQVTARQYPESALAFLDLAEAFFTRGDVDSATVNYERSLKLYPDNKPAREILNKLRSSR
jgi:glyoxylase-like metal-dependent hydrolase (beta-lactamase superfamily II)